jgi:hypothetical protein
MAQVINPVAFASMPKPILLKFLFSDTNETLEYGLAPETMTIKFPYHDSNTRIPVRIDATFPAGETSILQAWFVNVWGAELKQISSSHAFIKMHHGSDGRCTVRCPRTGTELTGLNPCLLCPTASGDVLELCC